MPLLLAMTRSGSVEHHLGRERRETLSVNRRPFTFFEIKSSWAPTRELDGGTERARERPSSGYRVCVRRQASLGLVASKDAVRIRR